MASPKAPEKLIGERGKPNVGVFSTPIEKLNYLDFIRPGKGAVSPKRIKRWQYVGIVGEKFIAGGAIVSLNLVGNVFFYLFDREKKKLLADVNFLQPLCRGINFDSNGVKGIVDFVAGASRYQIENNRPDNSHRITASLKGLRVNAKITDNLDPLSCVTRVGYSGFNYTLKLAGMPAAAEVEYNGQKFVDEKAFAVIDYTTGCLARETFWNWASGGGLTDDGKRVGINLVLGVNESGFTENAFWIDDKLIKVDTVNFDYDGDNILSPWRIKSWDGKVDLVFKPEGQREENINLSLMASKFHQPFGSFSGKLTDDAGYVHNVSKLHGYVEEHFARW